MKLEAKIKNIIFVSEGGIGKTIASTAIVKRLAEDFPNKKIIVVTGYPDIFAYNPHVHKVFNFNNPLYFYDDYITPESYVIKVEPYTSYDYMFKNKHIIDVWCDMIGIKRNGAMPEMFFLDNEIEAGKAYVEKVTQKKKKFAMFQWIGGLVPQNKDDGSTFDAIMRMHRRSIPKIVAQKVVNKLIARNYVVGVVQHENFPDLEGCEKLFFQNTPPRGVIALIKSTDAFIGIDSYMQHACASLGKKGLVLWGGTHPKKLGYPLHKNLVLEGSCQMLHCHRPDSYVFDMSPNTGIWNCPYNTACLKYDADKIIEEFEKLNEVKVE